MPVAVSELATKQQLLDDSLFDDSSGYEDDRGYIPPRELSEQEKRQARALYRLLHGLWGLCIVRGDPGTGKDTFLNWFLYTAKRFFPEKRILRDEKPRRLFGKYAGLFNEARIQDDLATMREAAKGVSAAQLDEVLETAADKWVNSKRAQAMLSNSIVGLTEFWKYVYNREPHNPMNKTMGGIHKLKRHFPFPFLASRSRSFSMDLIRLVRTAAMPYTGICAMTIVLIFASFLSPSPGSGLLTIIFNPLRKSLNPFLMSIAII